MTVVKDNTMTTGMSGMFGKQMVFRQRDGRTIVAKKPRRTRAGTPGQAAHKQRFLKAVEYARQALANPELREMYSHAAVTGASAYNMAVADAMTAPVVEHIDAQGYTSASGGIIAVTVFKKFRLRSMVVRITLADGTLLEKGEAVQMNGGRVWHYTATEANPSLSGSQVTAIATDLPGNTAELSVTL